MPEGSHQHSAEAGLRVQVFDFTQLATDRELRSAVRIGSPMGQFSVGAILAALCSQLCLYGSRGRRRRLRHATCNKLADTFGPRTMGSLLCSLLASKRTTQLGGTTGVITGRVRSSIGSKDLKLAECVSNRVKCQHENHGVTLFRLLCSIRARSRTSPHIRAPLPLHCLCDSGRAVSMGCGQQTSSDRQQGCVWRCPGGQAAAVRSEGNTDIGATDPAASPQGGMPCQQLPGLHRRGVYHARGKLLQSCSLWPSFPGGVGRLYHVRRLYYTWGFF